MAPPTILITGPTGALGGRMIATLLERTDARILALVRAASTQEGIRRIRTAIGPHARESEIVARVEAIPGDLRKPPWESDPALSARLHDEVTEVIHLAAATDLLAERERLLQVNVGGTEAMLALARAMHRNGVLQRFVHFSTAFVVGSAQGRVSTETYPCADPVWANAYEESKYIAEGKVHDAITAGLPAMVFRPSIVVGDSRNGDIGTRGIFYHTVRKLGRSGLNVVPGDPSDRLHIVPIDFVCEAAVAIAADPTAIGMIFHLASDSPPNLETLLRVGGRTFDWIGRLRPVPMEKVARIGAAIPKVSDFVPVMGYFSSAMQFDTSNTRRLLSDSGIVMPETGDDYVHKLVMHSKVTGYLR
jgi:thioester reductase-like protein